MPTDVRGLVGAPSTPYSDGQAYQPRMGRLGDTIITQFRGKFSEANSRGQLFHFCSLVAGQTIALFTSTVQTYGLRNPSGSGVILELVRLELGYLSATQVPGNLVFMQAPVNNDLIATGSGGVTTATQAAGLSGQFGGPSRVSQCRTLTGITTVAPTVITRTLGLSAYTMPATNAFQGLTYTGYVFDGTDLLYPGQIMMLGATVAAAAGADVINMVALELPWVPGT